MRGLCESKKRTNIFEWLRINKYDIILLQETYIYCKQDTDAITRESGGGGGEVGTSGPLVISRAGGSASSFQNL